MVGIAKSAKTIDDAQQDDPILDESEEDESHPRATYRITSFGADFDIDGLVRRLQSEDIVIPKWQRGFVWTHRIASEFIESLLLGLPVPEIFLGFDSESNRYYVVDGQQRLRTIWYFYDGKFPAKTKTGFRKFALAGLSSDFEGVTYEDLSEIDRRGLGFSIIHATIVRQDAPAGEDTSMYQIFKRLNSGGRAVNPQEIRSAIYQGKLIDKIAELNDFPQWREIIARTSPRMKDHEMILRFMAMLYKGHEYAAPMGEFLNIFTENNRNPDDMWMRKTTSIFERTVEAFAKAKGQRAFRVIDGNAVNAAIFDSMSVGLANRISESGLPEEAKIGEIHDCLITNDEYLQTVTQGTSQERSVNRRLHLAKNAFADA